MPSVRKRITEVPGRKSPGIRRLFSSKPDTRHLSLCSEYIKSIVFGGLDGVSVPVIEALS